MVIDTSANETREEEEGVTREDHATAFQTEEQGEQVDACRKAAVAWTKARAKDGWATALNVIFCMLGALNLLPHRQPFEPTILVQLSVGVWASAPLLLSLWAMCALGQLYLLGWPRLAAVAPVTALLVASYIIVWSLEEHTPIGELGFLALCVEWCGGPKHTFCSHAPNIAAWINHSTSPQERAAGAVAFFRSRVFGDATLPTASWASDGAITVNGKSYRIGNPGCDTVVLLVGSMPPNLREETGWSWVSLDTDLGTPRFIAAVAAEVNAIAALLRSSSSFGQVHIYGCSVKGKIAYWAAATAPQGTYNEVLIDSGGTMGPASVKVVDMCGETWQAAVERWGGWYAPGAKQLAAPEEWQFDVGDLMLEACQTTNYTFGVGRYNHWGNYAGTLHTAQRARDAGCTVRVLEGHAAHCGYFFRSTCAHSC